MRLPARLTAVIVLVIGMAAGGLGTTTATAAIAPPGNLTPDASSVSGAPVLQWDRVTGALQYDVQVSASSSFSSTLYTTSTTNRRVTPTAQLPLGSIYWRVRAINSSGQAGAWSTADFTRAQVAGPTQLSPPNGGPELLQPANPPLLSWTSVPGSTGYEVEIDGADCDHVGATSYTTRTTSLVVSDPQSDGGYCWRVRAVRGTGLNTNWSPDSTYAIGPLPEIGAAQPGNSADTTIEDVVFDWDPVPGAKDYEIRVSTDDSFNTIVDTRVVKGTRYSPTVTLDNDQYWWQVRARNIFGATHEWSDTTNVPIRQFRRAWSAAPTLLHPTNSVSPAVGDDLYYQWSPTRLATQYRLDVGSDPNFSPSTFSSCYTTQTTYTPGLVGDQCMPSPGATKYWRVQALDGPAGPQVNGIRSATSTFVYDPGRVTQLSPANGATVAVPSLRWAPVQDADRYVVTVSWLGGSRSVSTTTSSYSWTPTDRLDPANNPYTWTVRSVAHNGDQSPLPINAGQTFSVSGAATATGAAPLAPLSPLPGAAASVRFPELTWEPMTGATSYQVYVGTAGSGFFTPLSDRFTYPAATDNSSNYISPGSYDWFVVGRTDTTSQTGATGSFSVRDLLAATGQKLALDGSGLDSASTSCTYFLDDPTSAPKLCSQERATPVLDWNPVRDAGYYLVYLSRDREMTNLVTQPVVTQNTRWSSMSALPESQAGAAYYWFVRPCKVSGICAPDPTRATNAFDKRSSVVEASAPAEGATVADDVTFSWRDYLATNQDVRQVNVTTGEQPGQAAQSYHLQVATTPAFSSLVDEATVDQTTYTAFSETYPEGLLYWRIQALDGSRNGLSWSPVHSFTKTSPTVSLTSPVSGATVPGTQPFRWMPLNFATSYDFEVYKDGDTTASPANRVAYGNSKQVAYTLSTPLPVASTPYVWRVRKADADDRRGAWSRWSSFTVTGAAPALVSPAAGAYVAANDALFSWNAVGGAASYRFERQAAGATSSTESVNTVSLAWAPTQSISDGAWEWRITALDASDSPIASSAWRSFSVDGTAPTVLTMSPTTTARPGANFVATFSEPVTGVNGTTMRLFVSGTRKALSATVTVTNRGKVATLDPAARLGAGKLYTARLSSSITDARGNALAATSWQVTAAG